MSGSTLTRAVYAALLLALLGLLLRLASWLWRWIGPPAERPSPGSRLVAALRGGLGALAGGRLLRLVAALLLDVLLQRRLFSVDPVRGAAHLAIVLGMSGLVLLHALQRLISERLVAGYASTLDPWLWLRDLFGLLLIGGILVGIWRRRRRRGELPAPRRRDPLLVGLLLALCASGFLLGAVKIVSPRAFQRMVDEYAGGSAEETLPLRVHWARELGVALDGLPRVPDPKLLAAGKEAHEASCASCHSRPRSAVASYALSRALRPAGGRLARWNLEGILLQLHLALMLAALVYLPWSRLLHLIASPVSLLANAGASPAPAPENRATRRALAREACVRCGLCDERCSVRPLAALLENPAVLPAEKLLLVSALQRGRFDQAELRRVADGAQACTECGRCTRVCPSGIDLVDLWAAGRAELDRRGAPRAAAWIKAIPAARWAERLAAAPATPHPPPGLKLGSALTAAPPAE